MTTGCSEIIGSASVLRNVIVVVQFLNGWFSKRNKYEGFRQRTVFDQLGRNSIKCETLTICRCYSSADWLRRSWKDWWSLERVCRRKKLKVNTGKSKVIKCSRAIDGARTDVRVNGEQLRELDCFKNLRSSDACSGCKSWEKWSTEWRKQKCVVEWKRKIFKHRTLSVSVKRGLCDVSCWNMEQGSSRKETVNWNGNKIMNSICQVTIRDKILKKLSCRSRNSSPSPKKKKKNCMEIWHSINCSDVKLLHETECSGFSPSIYFLLFQLLVLSAHVLSFAPTYK